MTKTKKSLQALVRAVNRLSDKQGAVARRNARRAIGAAYRVLKQRIEEEYPSLVKPKASRTLTLAARRAKLQQQGYVQTGSEPRMLAAMAAAGVRVVIVKYQVNTGFPPGPAAQRTIEERWIPKWCLEVGADVNKLRRAKKSQGDRQAYQAASALLAMSDKTP